MAYYEEYAWLIVIGALVAFVMAYGIGANDVANAFATSVGSKTLTLVQAVILAGIFEFAGALLLGRGVTDTVRKGITKLEAFEDAPEVLMYGMFCALLGSAVWLLVATYFEMPVSTTHSIIGGIVGMALVAYGGDAVVWHEIDHKKDFPVKGISSVVISWVFSPVASGIVATFFFLIARTFILRSDDSFNRTFIFLPVLVGIAIFINGFYVLDKGKFGKLFKEGGLTTETCAWVAAIIAAVCILAAIPFSMWLKKRAIAQEEGKDVEDPKDNSTAGKEGNFFMRMAAAINSNDPHSAVDEDQATKEMHDNAEVFDERTESAFRYLQVLTACCDAFAHGANDVANSIGPFSAMWHVYTKQALSKKSDVPVWILVIGGAGIVVGLATYGYSIIKAIGVKLTKITPSRGFCIEMGSALIVVTGSYLGLPLSTTHCQVGATAFVGLLEGAGGISYTVLGKTVFGWIFTLIIVGFISAILMVLGIRTPNLRTSHAIDDVEGVIADYGRDKAVELNKCAGRSADAESTFYFFEHFTQYYRFPDRVASATAYMEDVTEKSCSFVVPGEFEVLDDEEVLYSLKDVAPSFIEHGQYVETTETMNFYEEITDLLDEFESCKDSVPRSYAFAKSLVQEDGIEDGETKYKGRLLFPKSKNTLKAAKDFVTFLEGDDEEVPLDENDCKAIDAQAPAAFVLP